MTEILQIPSTTRSGVKYTLTIDTTHNNVKCTCQGFQCHGYCKHTRMYRPLINQKLYGDPFKQKVITSFNNCYDFIINLCEQYPETKGDYNKLDQISKHVMEGLGIHYATETLHRSYRKAVENGEILEPITAQIRKEKTERVMHDINRWSPTSFKNIDSNQTLLVDDGEGYTR